MHEQTQQRSELTNEEAKRNATATVAEDSWFGFANWGIEEEGAKNVNKESKNDLVKNKETCTSLQCDEIIYFRKKN